MANNPQAKNDPDSDQPSDFPSRNPQFKSIDEYFQFLDEYWTLFGPPPEPDLENYRLFKDMKL